MAVNNPCQVSSCSSLAKYKCPLCKIPYCSVACFKSHKETPCQTPLLPLPNTQKVIINSNAIKAASCNPDGNQQAITLSQQDLEQLERSPKMLELLQDPQLQALLLEISSHSSPDKQIDHFIQSNPKFIEFADLCKSLTGEST